MPVSDVFMRYLRELTSSSQKVSEMKDEDSVSENCQAIYSGPSFPKKHGVKCMLPRDHSGQRHRDGMGWDAIAWWDEAQKNEIRRKRLEDGK